MASKLSKNGAHALNFSSGVLEVAGVADSVRDSILDATERFPGTSGELALENPAALQITGLDKSFGEREVLKDLSLSVPEGAFVAVIGHSGCGKSTLLRLIAGLDEPTSGEIALDGETVSGINPQVRVMFQEARLLPWKRVIDNVALGLPRAARPRAQGVLESVGLGDRAGDWPSILSGGQRQRVALARALAGAPRFLLLDEPLGALDALTRLEMQALLESIWQEHKFTALLITHDVEEAVTLADYVVVMDEGRFIVNEPVPLPRPRDHSDPQFVEITQRLLKQVRAMKK
ncbi:aliphatic sulfonates import ATP-binding protein SsuB [Abditibacteriota bacterium]|nr:aliphatic sulfonates import ATP-binding protein SsuB [Abditibacteriota bacterium]